MPTEVFPQMAPLWKLLASIATDVALPTIYTTWANSTKAERRVAFLRVLEMRAHSADAACLVLPIATKELYEMVLQAQVAPHAHQVNDLTAGISPFTCGFMVGERGSPVPVHVERYDLLLQGLIALTVVEQEQFCTKEVPLPMTTYHCGAMLQGTSIVLDVIQGVNHPHAIAYHHFCTREWKEMVTILELSGLAAEGNILP